MNERELLARLLAEYDEDCRRAPSFMTMELVRQVLDSDRSGGASPCPAVPAGAAPTCPDVAPA